MKRPRLPIGTFVGVTVGLVIALGLRPISVREILAAYVLALTAIALLTLTRMARTDEEWERATSDIEHALTPRKPVRTRPAELVRMERDITLSIANAAEFHARLRPLLLSIAVRARPAPGRGARRRHLGATPSRSPPSRRPHGARAFAAQHRHARRRGGESLMELSELRERSARILDEVERAVVGKRGPLELILLAILSDGHVLLEDYPGLAKTLIARSFASATSLEFSRIQFTPDLMPSDVTGSSVFDQRRSEFEFMPGPIFTNLLLADEINRAPPKTQAALLEAMQERQVTSEGETRVLAPPFIVLATQNPIEYEGTYPLPEAQLDRFLIRASIGYPAREDEIEMLGRRIARGEDEVELSPVVDAPTLVAMQQALERVHVSDSIEGYIVDVVAATRASRQLAVGASPRGSLALLKLSRAKAALAGRDFVVPEDVKAVAVPALAHRLTLRPELWVQRIRGEDVVVEALDSVPTPPAEDVRAAS